jgi:hypothetical protein
MKATNAAAASIEHCLDVEPHGLSWDRVSTGGSFAA